MAPTVRLELRTSGLLLRAGLLLRLARTN